MASDKPRPRRSRLSRWRFWVQGAFLVAWLEPFFLLRLHTVCGPVFHCYSCPLALLGCPIGILANFSALHVFPFAALGTLLLVGALVGSLVCGWACPFGFLQDLLGRIPAPKFSLPAWTGVGRYLVLAGLVVAVPYFWGEAHDLFFCRVCPAGALEAAVPHVVDQAAAGETVDWPSWPKMAVLGATLLGAVFLWRPWCTVLCPLGAIYALCNRFSVFFLRFHADRCRDCALCRGMCRGGEHPEDRVDGMRCVRCLECRQCNSVSVQTVFHREEATSWKGDEP